MKAAAILFPALAAMLFASGASAKLPAPSDEARAKAAEAAAKTAHADKMAAYQLCRRMDKVAAEYVAAARNSGMRKPAAVATPPCADPGPFVYKPAAPATAAVTASTKK